MRHRATGKRSGQNIEDKPPGAGGGVQQATTLTARPPLEVSL